MINVYVDVSPWFSKSQCIHTAQARRLSFPTRGPPSDFGGSVRKKKNREIGGE